MKLARAVLRAGEWYRLRRNIIGEKRLSADPEIKQYIRAKRNTKNLPDPYGDTQPIKIQKSWKWRCNKLKQWIKHKLSYSEKNYLHLGLWYIVTIDGIDIKVQEHEKYVICYDGVVYISKEDPNFYHGVTKKYYFDLWCRKIDLVLNYKYKEWEITDG